jgi:transposase-like protein
VQKADLQPESGKAPNQIAVDETVIRINSQQFWLYAAADPATNQLLHVRLFSTMTTALTEMFLRELRQNTMSKLPGFSEMVLSTSKLHYTEMASDFRCVVTEIGTLSNESFEN